MTVEDFKAFALNNIVLQRDNSSITSMSYINGEHMQAICPFCHQIMQRVKVGRSRWRLYCICERAKNAAAQFDELYAHTAKLEDLKRTVVNATLPFWKRQYTDVLFQHQQEQLIKEKRDILNIGDIYGDSGKKDLPQESS